MNQIFEYALYAKIVWLIVLFTMKIGKIRSKNFQIWYKWPSIVTLIRCNPSCVVILHCLVISFISSFFLYIWYIIYIRNFSLYRAVVLRYLLSFTHECSVHLHVIGVAVIISFRFLCSNPMTSNNRF